MNITKTKMLQKMGKEGRTYSADFAANNQKLKKLIPIYEVFHHYLFIFFFLFFFFLIIIIIYHNYY